MTTTKAETIATVTLTKLIGDGYRLTATATLHRLAGNQRPYFSVTGELTRYGHERAGGMLHEEIAKHFPQLAPVMALHLADDRGVPMYAADNGAYWLGLGDPRYVPEDAPRLDIFAGLWRVDEARARELYAYAEADNHSTEALRSLAKGEAERWQREADEAVALIRRLADKQKASA
jgi:hypothetical protein